jgi:hypothetical protein
MQRLLTLLKALGGTAGLSGVSGGTVDALLQTFENCRLGLPDETARQGGRVLTEYFLDLYAKELPRLRESFDAQESYLQPDAREELFERLDDRIRNVVIPAYCRLAAAFTLRERNDFFLVPSTWHMLERVGWGLAGVGLGAFIVWAPFIPLWSKEWVLVFMIGGVIFPNLRRFVAFKRYEGELNRLAGRTEQEIARLDLALMTRGALGRSTREAQADNGASSGHGAAPPTPRRRAQKEGR